VFRVLQHYGAGFLLIAACHFSKAKTECVRGVKSLFYTEALMSGINFLELAVKAAKIAEDKKALNAVVLDVMPLTAMANYFVIATAESTPQINAVCGEIEKTFKENGVLPVRREGISSQSWRVIDYGGLVIHVMSPEIRDSYQLETLWKNAKSVKFEESAILKIANSKKVKELEKNVEKVLNAGEKKAIATAKAVKKVSKEAKKKAAKTVQAGKKQLKQAKKTAKKVSKEVKKTLKEKVKGAKKAALALSKGVEAFKKTLLETGKKKTKKKK
jgi:ribosome-associated protein